MAPRRKYQVVVRWKFFVAYDYFLIFMLNDLTFIMSLI